MSAIAYGDESHIHSKNAPCYGIGCFLVPDESAEAIERQLNLIFQKYGIDHELKWNRIKNYRADLEAAHEGVLALLRNGATFHSMIVEKRTYAKWRGSKEEAFYTTYYQLAVHVIAHAAAKVELRLDYRSDKYPKQAEVLGIIANHALTRIKGSPMITGVSMIDSKTSGVLQMTDLLLGAITADTNLAFKGALPLNDGKLELIARYAGLIGWRRLCYDTMPNDVFNIWHFPLEFRSRPGTMATEPSWLQQAITARP